MGTGRGAGRWFVAAAAVLLLWACAGPSLLETRGGRDLAALQLSGLVGTGGGHLGLPEGRPFQLAEVGGEILVLELFNSHCPACRMQAKDMEAFYAAVSGDDAARGVRVLAVGMGDRAEDLRAFRSGFGLTYPMAPDPGYEAYAQLGAMTGTPTTLFLAGDGAGRWRVAGVLRGLHDREALLAEVDRVRAGGGGGLPLPATPVAYDPPLGLDAGARQVRVLALLRRVDPGVAAAEEVAPGGGARVYRARGSRGAPLDLFARIASRNPPCDVCHTSHLVVAFDRRGVVLGVDLIYAPKAGNVPFTADEAEAVGNRLVGRQMAGIAFDPGVDAVSGATITSGVIYDEVRRTAALLTRLP